jgi:hypothetical protein
MTPTFCGIGFAYHPESVFGEDPQGPALSVLLRVRAFGRADGRMRADGIVPTGMGLLAHLLGQCRSMSV